LKISNFYLLLFDLNKIEVNSKRKTKNAKQQHKTKKILSFELLFFVLRFDF